MKKYLLIAFLVWAATGSHAAAATLEGQRFDDTVSLASQDLKLNGLGLRSIFIFKGYVAGLYLGEKASTHQEVLLIQGPKRLQLRMLREAKSEDFKKALVDGIQKNVSAAEWAALQDRISQFERTIESIGIAKKGDTINLDYVPGHGMTLSVNDAVMGTAISGPDFYNAVLGIFVGDNPVDTRLKKGLLGQ